MSMTESGPYLAQCKWGDSTRPLNFRAPPTRLQKTSISLLVSFFFWWLYVSFFCHVLTESRSHEAEVKTPPVLLVNADRDFGI
jgi:hypothetical protein